MNTPKVSVIIPVYNTEKYLQACIDSLISQTILDKMELIFVNDASPDNCLNILRKNQAEHPDRIRVIDSQENLCQGGARNLGLRAAKGDYIGFVDSDDFVSPTMYEKLYDKAITVNADAVFCEYVRVPKNAAHSDTQKYLTGGGGIKREAEEFILENPEMTADFLVKIIKGSGICMSLWKKEIILDNNIFFPEHLKYEDHYWGLLIKPYIKRIAIIHEIEYFYRNNPASTVNNINSLKDKIPIEERLLNEIKKRNIFYQYQSSWEYICTIDAFSNCLGIASSKTADYDLAKKFFAFLNAEFPSWQNNKYYLNEKSLKFKLFGRLAAISPAFAVKLFRPLYKIRDCLRSFKYLAQSLKA